MRIDQIELSGRHERPERIGMGIIVAVNLAVVAVTALPAVGLWYLARIDPLRVYLLFLGLVQLCAAAERPKALFQVSLLWFRRWEPWKSLIATPQAAKWVLVTAGAALLLAGTLIHTTPGLH